MRLKHILFYTLFAGILVISQAGCYKEIDCSQSSANLAPPVPQATFRLVDAQGRDLFASITPGYLSFDSVQVSQPCNINTTLTKHIEQTGAGGLESYRFHFEGMRQPVTGENQECFTVQMKWSDGKTDLIEFDTRSEHHVCGITYYLDAVVFNGKEAKKDGNGNYLLQK